MAEEGNGTASDTMTAVDDSSACTLSVAASDSLNGGKYAAPLPLVCGQCGRDYDRPKLLPCFHTHCAKCLELLAPSNSLAIQCPKCELQFVLPAGGVGALADNQLFGEFSRQPTEAEKGPGVQCLTHAEQPLNFYCRTCDKLLCEKCSKVDPLCVAHKIDTVRDVAKAQRLLLLDLLRRTESSFPSLLTARTKAKGAVASLKQKYVAIRDELQRLFNDLHSLLNKREHQLLAMLEARFAEKRKALDCQESELSRSIDAYNKTRKFLDSVLLTGSDVDVMIAKKEMSDFYTKLNSRSMSAVKANDAIRLRVQLDELRKQIEAFGAVEINNAVAMETCTEGTGVKSACAQEESSFKVTLKDAEGQIVNMPLDEGELQVEIKSPFNDLLQSRISYDDAGNYLVAYQSEYPGLYEISVKLRGEPIKDSPFSVRCSRRDVQSNGQLTSQQALSNRRDDRSSARSAIRGFSPSAVSVRSRSNSRSTEQTSSSVHSMQSSRSAMLEKASNSSLLSRSRTSMGPSRPTLTSARLSALQKSTTTASTMSLKRTPTPLISSRVSSRSNMSVAASSVDIDGACSSIGAYAAIRIGHRGTNVGQFSSPQGVAFSPSLNAYIVADSSNHNVQLFDCRNSQFLRQFGIRGRADGQMLKPTGVAEYKRGSLHHLLVSDFENKCINEFDLDGQFKERFGDMKVLGPKGVAVDHEGRVLVADHRAGCVCVFSGSSKKLVQRVGGRGSAEHQLSAPSYLAVNGNNDIIVTDFQQRKVKLFSAEGRYLFSFSLAAGRSTSSNAGGPTGVAVDDKGRILVADWPSATLQVFDNNGCFLQYVNTAADPLVGPQGLSVTSSYGTLVVTDTGNCCVKVYRYQ